ncbi:hypothetical protein NMG60_11014002 [Bertholletia excelsa]
MAARKKETALTIVLVATLWAGAMSQPSCQTVLIGLSPCLDYITGKSSTPSSGCCTQLANVVGTQPQCLCEVINNSSSLGISINQTQALELPKICNVETPPVSSCSGGNSSDGYSIKLPFSLLFFFVFVISCASTFTAT